MTSHFPRREKAFETSHRVLNEKSGMVADPLSEKGLLNPFDSLVQYRVDLYTEGDESKFVGRIMNWVEIIYET